MEQKKTLWIVLAAGIFLLTVLGAALMANANSKNKTSTGSVWISPVLGETPTVGGDFTTKVPDPEDSTTPAEVTVIQDDESTVVMPKVDDPLTEPAVLSGKDATINVETATINAGEVTVTAGTVKEETPTVTTIDLNSLGTKDAVKTTDSTTKTTTTTPASSTTATAGTAKTDDTSSKTAATTTAPSASKTSTTSTTSASPATSASSTKTSGTTAATSTSSSKTSDKTTAASSSTSKTSSGTSSTSSTASSSTKTGSSSGTTSSSTKTSAAGTTKSTASTSTASSTTKTTGTTAAPLADSYWIQAASYSSKKNADDARVLLEQNKLPCEVFTYKDSSGSLHYRVRVGPYTTKNEAKYWQEKIAAISFFANTETYITNSNASAK